MPFVILHKNPYTAVTKQKNKAKIQNYKIDAIIQILKKQAVGNCQHTIYEKQKKKKFGTEQGTSALKCI